ncbi:5'-nucleotidase [Dysgonomonas hofstadii]|uniref:5'-nucleotidase n=1 Tax=Dysgonomonas hofstadii TaxID=637886 RepID=A0A840CWU2_9BACT|nr:metallophosphatase [Dysgonomonas hofstadii]MBB4036922.1 5'-nucleotidase [Dysgonomonas hofstadii]
MNQKYICFLLLVCFSLSLAAQKKLVILHTNDTHSRIEPMPATDIRNPNMGGVVNRKAVIDSIRTVEKNVLLFDIGDFVQGTPYFNLFKGRVEAKAMDMMKYDVGTIGNHEFDYGLDSMKMVFDLLDYPLVCCNYDFSKTVLKDKVKPYIILKKAGVKIGIIGAGVDPDGMIQKDKYEGMGFLPVIETVNRYAEQLKLKDKCDIVICLSHVGYNPDKLLAEKSRYLDIIIGGHSHTFMKAPDMIPNQAGKNVFVYQVGKNGVYIGKIEIELAEK